MIELYQIWQKGKTCSNVKKKVQIMFFGVKKILQFDTLEQKSLISTFDQNGDIGITEEEF